MINAKRRRGGRGAAGLTTTTEKTVKYGLSGTAVVTAFALASSNGSSGVGSPVMDFDFSLYQGASEAGFLDGNSASLHGRPMGFEFLGWPVPGV